MTLTTSASDARSLDPFGFFTEHMSIIRPLGGRERGPDPTYAFHTPYLEFRPGPLVFTIRFDGLEASFGELVVHVNSFVPGGGANALLVTMTRAYVAELATGAAELMIKINALPNVGFALFGYFPEGTDASAAGLTIMAEEYGYIESGDISAEALTPTRFGSDDLMRPHFFVDDTPARFRQPVSQAMTPGQLDEDAYLRRVAQLPGDRRDPYSAWPRAFILETLDRYGMLRPGAAGLALGDGDRDLIDAALSAGCELSQRGTI